MTQSIRRNKKLILTNGIPPIFSFGLVFIFLFNFYSCKKENDNSITIKINFPAGSFQGFFNDSINVKAEITSTSIIKSVTIRITDLSYVPVTSPFVLYPGVKEFTLNTLYLIDNKTALSGDYYLEISASDGDITEYGYTTIFLNALPRKVEAYYVLTRNSNSSFNVFKSDSISLNLEKTVNGDFIGSSVDSKFGLFYTCGSITGSLNYFNTADFSDVFTLFPNSPPTPTFITFHHSGESNFIGFYDGSIKAFDHTGFKTYETGPDPYYYSNLLYKSDDYVIAELQSTGVLNQKKIAAYFYPSGVIRQSLNVNFDIIGINDFSYDEKLVFATENGRSLIYKYSISSNNISLFKDAGSIDWQNVTFLSSTKYIISSLQGLYQYNLQTASVLKVANFQCFNSEFDFVNNLLLCQSSNEIHVLNASTFQENYSIPSPDSIIDCEVLYNK